MNNKDLIDLMNRFEASGIARMRYQSGDTVVEFDKNAAAASLPVSVSVPAPAADTVEATASRAVPASPSSSSVAGSCINASFVGTFYAKPAPDKDPFVSVGDEVKAGQTVCLLEAMKMMSEVQAPCDCVIEEIIAVDGELVSFDAPLMRYREV